GPQRPDHPREEHLLGGGVDEPDDAAQLERVGIGGTDLAGELPPAGVTGLDEPRPRPRGGEGADEGDAVALVEVGPDRHQEPSSSRGSPHGRSITRVARMRESDTWRGVNGLSTCPCPTSWEPSGEMSTSSRIPASPEPGPTHRLEKSRQLAHTP